MFLKPNTHPSPQKPSSSNSNLNLKQQKFNRKTTLAPPLPSRIYLHQERFYTLLLLFFSAHTTTVHI